MWLTRTNHVIQSSTFFPWKTNVRGSRKKVCALLLSFWKSTNSSDLWISVIWRLWTRAPSSWSSRWSSRRRSSERSDQAEQWRIWKCIHFSLQRYNIVFMVKSLGLCLIQWNLDIRNRNIKNNFYVRSRYDILLYLSPPTIIIFLTKFGGLVFLSTRWNIPRGKYIWNRPRLRVAHIWLHAENKWNVSNSMLGLDICQKGD